MASTSLGDGIAGVDLGIIHPFGVASEEEALLI